MIPAIKFFPLKLRTETGACEAVGPSIKSAREIDFLFDGSTLSMMLPGHSPAHKTTQQLNYTNRDICSESFERISRGTNTRWEQSEFLSREWAYWGPWFSGRQADLSIYGVAFRIKGQSPDQTSLFNPKYFENCLTEVLNIFYGARTNKDGLALFTAPVNWNTGTKGGVEFAEFQITPIEPRVSAPYRKCIALPTSSSTLAILFIASSIHRPGFQAEKLELVDTSRLELMQQYIIDSIKLTLSPQAQADLEKAKSECPGAKLTETFAPLMWPVGKEQAPLKAAPNAINQAD